MKNLCFPKGFEQGLQSLSEEIQHDVWPRHIIVDNEDQRLGNKQPLVLKGSQWLQIWTEIGILRFFG